MVMQSVRAVLNEITKAVFSLFGERNVGDKWTRLASIACGLAIAGGALFGAYRWHSHRKTRSAQFAFAHAQDAFERARESKSETGDVWRHVAEVAHAGYDAHAWSDFAPHFLVLESHAYLEQADHAKALEVMDKAVGLTSKNSPLSGLVQLRRALMMLDDADGSVRENGERELKSLSADQKNINRDSALFYLGRYYWSKDMREEARDVWYDLVETYAGQNERAPSPWALEVIPLLERVTGVVS